MRPITRNETVTIMGVVAVCGLVLLFAFGYWGFGIGAPQETPPTDSARYIPTIEERLAEISGGPATPSSEKELEARRQELRGADTTNINGPSVAERLKELQ